MKLRSLLPALFVVGLISVASASRAQAFELLDRVLNLGNAGGHGCCAVEPACDAAPAPCCAPCAPKAKCKPARQHRPVCLPACPPARRCAAEPVCPPVDVCPPADCCRQPLIPRGWFKDLLKSCMPQPCCPSDCCPPVAPACHH